jgi:hypothetical protein
MGLFGIPCTSITLQAELFIEKNEWRFTTREGDMYVIFDSGNMPRRIQKIRKGMVLGVSCIYIMLSIWGGGGKEDSTELLISSELGDRV